VRRLVAVLGACVLGSVALLGMSGVAVFAGPAATASATAGGGTVTITKSVTRSEVEGGKSVVVSSRTVTLHVSQTTGLQGRQEIGVSWTGAHPTGAIVGDSNSTTAEYEEFPFVLLECRGVDSTSVSPADQLTPETCWTQSSTERYQSSYGDTYPPYRLDEYAATPGAAVVGAPSSLPSACLGQDPPVQYWVPWDAADGDDYPGGPLGCAGEPPEANDVGGSALPSNETFGVTGKGGTGSADFNVWTTDQNETLGCSETVACALVAIPIMGISCDPAPSGATPPPTSTQVSQCETTGIYPAGSATHNTNPGTVRDVSVTGSLWWSPSNWRNRITVPLSFAPSPDLCNVTQSAGNNLVQVFGSELMIQATTQWEPHFCTSDTDPFSFVHVQTGEPEARNLLANGDVEAAFTSYAQPGGYGKPVVNAPVAATGFAISYSIDGSNGQPYTTLKLTPLLLAKLLTESYPGTATVRQEDPALAHNPLDITEDPQFMALNPGIPEFEASGSLSEAASELIAMSSDSDVIEALTTYINDDPVARAWLNGTPDQWGMVVNPAYQGIALPVDQWPLLSTFEPTYDVDTGSLTECLFTDPVPYLPLIAAPLASLEDISEAIQYDLPNSTTRCVQPITGSPIGEEMTTQGRQAPGHHFMIGITPLADSQRYLLQTAALETTTGTYVAPSSTSLKAATSLLTPDPTTGTWPIPYNTFQTAAGASAYPGTMIVYAAIPTTGLPTTDAKDYATLLRFAATTGQTPGPGVGQLPPGYLPLTAADGLSALADYTLAAATDVAAQNGQVPALVPAPPSGSSSSKGTSSAPSTVVSPPVSASGSAEPFGGLGLNQDGQPLRELSILSAPSVSGKTKAHKKGGRTVFKLVQLSPTADVSLWVSGLPVILFLGLALLGILTVPAMYRAGRRRGRW
jgi:hypothetical protein